MHLKTKSKLSYITNLIIKLFSNGEQALPFITCLYQQTINIIINNQFT